MKNTQDLLLSLKRRGNPPPPNGPWIESWFNKDLPFHLLTNDQQMKLMQETSRWLFAGRRWPREPSNAQERHCIFWFDHVHALMGKHGWGFAYDGECDMAGYKGRWIYRDSPDHFMAWSGTQIHFAATVGAAICRRKARYYGLWQSLGNTQPRNNKGN